MKATGIVRNLDALGRVVIPKELRDTFGLTSDTPVEILVENEDVILRAYKPDCIFCGEVKDVFNYEGKNICKECLRKIKKMK